VTTGQIVSKLSCSVTFKNFVLAFGDVFKGLFGKHNLVSVQLPPGAHFRDQIYRKIAANQISGNQESDNLIC
jgi:hypothetical protein